METLTARRFRVHPRHLPGPHARVVAEVSFEAAAVAFVEDSPPAVGDSAELAIVVRDLETGVEHCFLIDPASGETSPCG